MTAIISRGAQTARTPEPPISTCRGEVTLLLYDAGGPNGCSRSDLRRHETAITMDVIELRVDNIAQLFHTLDPFPFREPHFHIAD
jgi:hypothetical protein